MGPAPGAEKALEHLRIAWRAIRAGERWSREAGRTIEPDILLHQRRSGRRNNEIACEVKRLSSRLGDIAYDTAKLLALREDLAYAHPILLVIGLRHHTSVIHPVRSLQDARDAIERVREAKAAERTLNRSTAAGFHLRED